MTTTTTLPSDLEESDQEIQEAEQDQISAVQSALTALLNSSNSSNGSANILVNTSRGEPVQVTLVRVNEISENETLEVESPTSSVSVPGSVLQQIAASAGVSTLVLAVGPTGANGSVVQLDDSSVLIDAASGTTISFLEENGNPIAVENLTEPIEFTLPVSSEAWLLSLSCHGVMHGH